MAVHFISPYSDTSPPNIGGAINLAIMNLAAEPEDWIVLTDHDVLFLLPDTKKNLITTLAMTTYSVLGCMTNRVGITNQCFDYMFDDDSISNHIKMARLAWESSGHGILETKMAVAGFLMCFKVKTWAAVQGFLEHSIIFDVMFCRSVQQHLHGKIGIMRGIYVFHLYRYESKNPREDIAHLE